MSPWQNAIYGILNELSSASLIKCTRQTKKFFVHMPGVFSSSIWGLKKCTRQAKKFFVQMQGVCSSTRIWGLKIGLLLAEFRSLYVWTWGWNVSHKWSWCLEQKKSPNSIEVWFDFADEPSHESWVWSATMLYRDSSVSHECITIEVDGKLHRCRCGQTWTSVANALARPNGGGVGKQAPS